MALAPLHDVTDTVFRRLIASKGRPDVMFTEFVSVDGLCHEQSREKMIWRYLRYADCERPLVAQIWGSDPDKFRTAAQLVANLGFDGVDINMGCPEKSAVKHGACAALAGTPKLAQDIIRTAKAGAGERPVSVKIRLGVKKNIIEDWLRYVLEAEPAAITVHGRTAKDLSRVPADWEAIGRAVQIARGSPTLIIGNGDVMSLEEAAEKARTYGVDGVMFGRAVFQNHWLFDRTKNQPPTSREKLLAMIQHAKLYEKIFDSKRSFAVLRKHFKAYTAGIPGAKDLRLRLMSARDSQAVEKLVNNWLQQNN